MKSVYLGWGRASAWGVALAADLAEDDLLVLRRKAVEDAHAGMVLRRSNGGGVVISDYMGIAAFRIRTVKGARRVRGLVCGS